jgi:hypothetical protein
VAIREGRKAVRICVNSRNAPDFFNYHRMKRTQRITAAHSAKPQNFFNLFDFAVEIIPLSLSPSPHEYTPRRS